MANFDNLHGLARKCKKPDDELKTFKLNFINNLNNLLTLI